MTRRIATTRRVAVGTALVLTAGLGWLGTGAASAATPSVSCQTTNGFVKFVPGLSSTKAKQKETLGGKLGTCTGKVRLTGGSISGTLASPGAIKCKNLLGGAVGSGNEVLHYSDGTSSTASVTIRVTTNGNFTINGSVIKGRFKGHKVTAPMTLDTANPTNPGANCGLAYPVVKITQVNFSGTTTVS